MVTYRSALGPLFDAAPGDTEETLVGSSAHQDAIVALTTGLRLSGDVPWQPAQQQSLRVGTVGPPALIIEVASPSTARERDLSDDHGRSKPVLYATIGVVEYLVFDPFGEFHPERVRGYRAAETPHGRQFVPWEPGADGRWHRAALGVSFAPQGFLPRVYDADSTLLPISEELDDRNANLTNENRYRAEENRRLTAQANDAARRLAALEAELRRLREREES